MDFILDVMCFSCGRVKINTLDGVGLQNYKLYVRDSLNDENKLENVYRYMTILYSFEMCSKDTQFKRLQRMYTEEQQSSTTCSCISKSFWTELCFSSVSFGTKKINAWFEF